MKEITIEFPDGTKETRQFGIRANELVSKFGELKFPLAAVLIDNELCSLFVRVEVNCFVSPVTIESSQGAMAYRRSLCFILAIASRELFPDRSLVVGHSLGSGYYYTYEDGKPVPPEDIDKLQARMRGIVVENQSIKHTMISYREALEYFQKTAQLDTLLLLKHMSSAKIPLNECRGFKDLAVAPLVPTTGILDWFELMPYKDGFLLRYPATGAPYEIPAFKDDPVLFDVYKEYRRWGKILGISSVGALNEMNEPRRIKEFIRIAETLQTRKIAEIADGIAARADKIRCVLIAGPSSSGKTTFSKKLAIQLKVLGFEPVNVGLDDYFVDKARTPRDAEGNYDFECLEALDTEYLNGQLLDMFAGKTVELPAFDFKTGSRRSSGKFVAMKGNEILVMEGIHGLNDQLTYRIPREQKFKVYVSALTQLNLDDHNRIATTDNRLIRRIVRDYQFRGHSAKETLAMWPSVHRGERLHIFPFQNTADAALNSALDYELGVLKIYADPLLRTVKPYDPEFCESSRLLSFLDNFAPIPAQFVPNDSIIREFIGESEFKY